MTRFASATGPTLPGCGGSDDDEDDQVAVEIDPRASAFGHWQIDNGLPVFLYDADQTRLDGAEAAPRSLAHAEQWALQPCLLALRAGRGATGGRFASRKFSNEADGHGRLDAIGEVMVASERGVGELRW